MKSTHETLEPFPFFLEHFWDQKIYSLMRKIKKNMENQIKEKVLMKDYGKLTIILKLNFLVSR